jgi:CBS domain-containing protein
MTNRNLAFIIKTQKPLARPADEAVDLACRAMWESGAGSVLVVDNQQRLIGIFTGRDAVRLLASGSGGSATRLAAAMTRNPLALAPKSRAIDALRAMNAGGFRHVPVTENGKICGVVSRGDFKGMEFEEFLWPRATAATGSGADREIAQIVEGRTPLILPSESTLQHASSLMLERGVGSTLVIDSRRQLEGIFTGRDAVRAIAQGKGPASLLADAMTRAPQTIGLKCRAVDALRAMSDGGFRHLPVVENGEVRGIVSRSDFTGVEIDRLDAEEHLKECIW